MPCHMDSYSILQIVQYLEDVTTNRDQSSDRDCICFDHCMIFSYLSAKCQFIQLF